MAKKNGVAMDIPVRDLPPEHRQWLFEGDPKWKNWDSSWPRYWYGVRHFFDWLETKGLKMHIRVLLSRYRSYTECPACHGARLKPTPCWRPPTRAQVSCRSGASRDHHVSSSVGAAGTPIAACAHPDRD